MGHIKVLDRNMINMIAAGEVIERPASVVKELMENSIDGGASKIIVTVEDGGRKLISITDNGCGMDTDDLNYAFEPHATSKIKDSNDLSKIATLGFRGEALASISSVAIVKMVSRVKDSTGAGCVEIDCGDRKFVGPCSGDYGTTIEVRDIFYKLPARRKFLKTANTEFGHIAEQFTRIALANCQLDLTLVHNNRERFKLSAGQSISARIAELFSSDISENLIESENDEKNIRLHAMLGTPAISKTNNKLQYVFLNGRFIRDKFISHAIREAYRGNIENNRYPVVFLFIGMGFEDYDVNVHPTKTEVRFYNSNLLHSQILGLLREKILSSNFDVTANLASGGSFSTDSDGSNANPRKQQINEAIDNFFKKHKGGSDQHKFNFSSRGSSGPKVVMPSYNRIPAEAASMENEADSGEFIQIHDSYIVAETEDGFVLIDQHALHERVKYEQLRRRVSNGPLESQKLLLPESFDLTDSQKSVIADNADIFEKFGIEMVEFGPRTMAIQAFPTMLSKINCVEFVKDVIDLLCDKANLGGAEGLLDKILNMAACKAAIKAGQKLTALEIEQLLKDKKTVENSSRCPHGRPTTITFSKAEIEKQFHRT
ncbi:MAG: DNA mismatch repair endonuclease MutL [Planctomycetes bacterium]|nr:DNA mismatch repair endonuclease MutL [Planctomycetota bacterium]